jgi:hypothetical protein
VGSRRLVGPHARCRAGMERDPPGCRDLRLQDVSWRRIESQVDRIDRSADRVADPPTGAGQQPEPTRAGVRAPGAPRTTRGRRLPQRRDRGGGEAEGCRPAWGGEQAWTWPLGSGCRGLEVTAQPPCHPQASRRAAPPPGRSCLAGPYQCHLGSERTAVRLGVHRGHDLWPEDCLGAPLESAGVASTAGGHPWGVETLRGHRVAPPHGSATAAHASSAHVASLPVVWMDCWPTTSATAWPRAPWLTSGAASVGRQR